jgi:hypothetical protein
VASPTGSQADSEHRDGSLKFPGRVTGPGESVNIAGPAGRRRGRRARRCRTVTEAAVSMTRPGPGSRVKLLLVLTRIRPSRLRLAAGWRGRGRRPPGFPTWRPQSSRVTEPECGGRAARRRPAAATMTATDSGGLRVGLGRGACHWHNHESRAWRAAGVTYRRYTGSLPVSHVRSRPP